MKLFTQVSALLFVFIFSSGYISAQIIWSEDFTFPDGTTMGPAGKWTSACGACLAGDYFEVRSNSFQASDVNDWSVWQSETITISSCANVSFSLLAEEVGDHEGIGCGCTINQDYFDVYYSINGGVFQVIENWNNDGETGHTLTGDSRNGVFTDLDWESTTVSLGGLSGNSIQFRIEMRNTAGSEILILDDFVVNCTPLPVEMTSLQATAKDQGVEINWETSMESGSSHFLVEKSRDGTAFFSIGRVEAAGNSNAILSYQFNDHQPINGRNFYRLRQVDQDGSFSLTQVVEAISMAESLEFAALYPNPVSDQLNIEVLSRAENSGSVQVLDLMGHEVYREQIDLQAELNTLSINTSDFASGVYILRLIAGNEVLNKRFVVK